MIDILIAGALYAIGTLFVVNSAFYLWRWKDIKALSLGGILITYGLNSIYSAVIKSGYIVQVPALFGLDTTLSSFSMVAVAIQIITIFYSGFKWKKVHWLVFIYPFSQIGLYLPYLLLDAPSKLALINKVVSAGGSIYFFNIYSFVIHYAASTTLLAIILYTVHTRFKWKQVNPKFRFKVGLARTIFILFVVFAFFFEYSYIFDFHFVNTVSAFEYLNYYFFSYIFFLFVQLWPYYVKHGPVYFDVQSFRIEKYFTQYLEKADVKRIEHSLAGLINDRHIHRDENIKIGNLAAAIGITTHQLSTYLNQHLNQNFSEYINSIRINDAKSLLRDDPQMNILNLCYRLGYNSPSAFYKAFKNLTGCSPKEWVQKKSHTDRPGL